MSDRRVGVFVLSLALLCTLTIANSDYLSALNAISVALNGNEWTVKWPTSSSTDYCNWYGVECTDGDPNRLVALNLTGNNLKGTLPDELSLLETLEVLDVSSNQQLTGQLPASLVNVPGLWYLNVSHTIVELEDIFPELSKLADLSVLDAQAAGMNDMAIPMESVALPELKVLNLSANALTMNMTVPWKCPKLESLSIAGDTIHIARESISSAWASSVKNLQYLDFSEVSSLQGSLDWLQLLKNLTHLNLRSIGVYGTVPESFSVLTELEWLSLNFVDFHGTIPSSWSALSKLTYLDISDTDMLPWAHPELLLAWKDLQWLSLYSTHYIGSLPSEIGTLSRLEYLNLQSSGTNGTLPTSLAQCTSLVFLAVSSNGDLTGTIPADLFSNMHQLESLYLTQTGLIGPLPHLPTSIRRLDVSWLALNSSLPSEYGTLVNLESVDAEGCYLDGTLPPEMGNLRNLQVLNLMANEIQGSLPSEWAGMTGMQRMNLGGNQLSSTLPSEWHAMSQLTDLSLILNFFEGGIPDSWASLTSLNQLRLGGNRLDGTVPAGLLQGLTSLLTLSLEDNMLTGALPEAPVSSHFYELYLSNNSFSGTLPASWGDVGSITTIEVNSNKLNGTIPGSLANLPHLKVLRLYDNEFTAMDPGLLRISMPILDLHNNLIDLPRGVLEFNESIIVLNLDSNNVSLDFNGGDVYFGHSPPIIYFNNNPNIRGYIPYMNYIFRNPSDIIQIGLRNCSVRGNFDFMFPNIQYLDVSMTGISGLLPVQMLMRSTILTMNITGTNITGSWEGVPLNYNLEASYYANSVVCPTLSWGSSSVHVYGLPETFIPLEHCRCTPGYSGAPPLCNPPTNETTLHVVLGLLSVVLAACMAVIAGRYVRQWVVRNREMKVAQKMLDTYFTSSSISVPLLQQPLNVSDDWIIPYADLTIVRSVAAGASGSVSLAIWNHSYVAVKEFYTATDEQASDFAGEAALHVKLRHPNVVQLLGMSLDPLCMVTEWMGRGALFSVIGSDHELGRSFCDIALDIARGMAYLHSKGILHRDLKSLNVLLTETGVAKVADFGCSRLQSDTVMTVGAGTAAWMAPEVFEGGNYTEKCDIYSYAIILWELVTRKMPFAGMGFAHQIEDAVRSGVRPPLPEMETVQNGEQRKLIPLIQRCWAGRPADRPSFDEIVTELGGS